MPELDTRYGILSVPDCDTDLIGRFLARYGEWAWNEVQFIASILPAGARVLDIGAFVGTFSLGLAAIQRIDFFCLVEPNSLVLPYLAQNMTRTCRVQAVIEEALVTGNESESFPGYSEAGNLGSTTFSERNAADPTYLVTIPAPNQVTSIRKLREKHGDFDLIKVDAEGMELEIICGDLKYLSTGKSTLWIECNETPECLDLARVLLSCELELYYFAFSSFNPSNFLGDERPIFPYAYEAGLLAAPKTHPELSAALVAQGCILRKIASIEDLKQALWRTPRWGFEDWHNAPREEIVATAGRRLLGQEYATFLQSGNAAVPSNRPRTSFEMLRIRLRSVEKDLAAVDKLATERLTAVRTLEQLALTRLADLEAERERNAALEAHLSDTDERASQLSADLTTERDQKLVLQRDLASIQQRLAENAKKLSEQAARLSALKARNTELTRKLDSVKRQSAKRLTAINARLTAIEASTTWRASKWLRELAGRHLLLRRTLRSLAHIARAIKRRTHGLEKVLPVLQDGHFSSKSGDSKSTGKRRQRASGGGVRDSSLHLHADYVTECEAIQPYFDAAYYLENNPDIQDANLDPIHHFMTKGWREHRDPSAQFNTRYYLDMNQDVKASGINPLLHYAWCGLPEGRATRRPQESIRRRLEGAKSPTRQSVAWIKSGPFEPRLNADELVATLMRHSEQAHHHFVLSLSHDDYQRTFGGVQNVIGDEQRAFVAAAWGYLHASPAQPLPMLANSGAPADFMLSLRFNGAFLGFAKAGDLMLSVQSTRARGSTFHAVIHHLMGFDLSVVSDLVRACGAGRVGFWVHDFFSLCPSYTLMRNDIAFCGAPPHNSPACGICCYGFDRRVHIEQVIRLFQEIDPMVLAPSQSALDLWLAHGRLAHSETMVVPLCNVVFTDRVTSPSSKAGRLKVAFLGARAFQKGWTVFEELAFRHVNDQRFEFYQLGASKKRVPQNIHHIVVRVSASNRSLMVDTIQNEGIDVVVNWSLWPETFCFTAHEALAGGAFVIAKSSAGNVWPAIFANNPLQGCALDDEHQLFSLFEGEELFRLVDASDRRLGSLTLSGGSADWLLNSTELA